MSDAKEACKPSSVSCARGAGGDHPSSRAVASAVVRPSRGRTGRPYPSIRPCSEWGFPSPRCYQRGGALLPHHFTLTQVIYLGGLFLWHFPSGCPAPPLAGILPGGARTFLSSAYRRNSGRPASLAHTIVALAAAVYRHTVMRMAAIGAM